MSKRKKRGQRCSRKSKEKDENKNWKHRQRQAIILAPVGRILNIIKKEPARAKKINMKENIQNNTSTAFLQCAVVILCFTIPIKCNEV